MTYVLPSAATSTPQPPSVAIDFARTDRGTVMVGVMVTEADGTGSWYDVVELPTHWTYGLTEPVRTWPNQPGA